MSKVSEAPEYFRAGISRGAQGIERHGGKFSAGMIKGVSVITRGEALGHGMWIDADFLSDVTAAINGSKAASGGLKARFTHPGLSSDGLGSHLGRLLDARTEGDKVLADLHIVEAARNSPDGDLAEYVMGLADEDPAAFGMSIVFERDIKAEQDFLERHSTPEGDDSVFTSPDDDNVNNYLHARLSRLRAGDAVDEPAANPAGMFSRGQELPQEADALMRYAFKLTTDKPDTSMFGIDADRVTGFLSRFFERHQLELRGLDEMSEETTNPETDETPDENSELSGSKADTDADESVDETVKKALAADRKRAAEIRALGAKFGFEDDAAKFADSEQSVDEFRCHILDKSPEAWRASLAVKNPSQLNTDSDDDEGSEAVAKIKERRKLARA